MGTTQQHLQRPKNLEQLSQLIHVVQKPAPPKITLPNNIVRNTRATQSQIATHSEMNAASK